LAWESHGNNIYYYRIRRCGKRILREYVGTGPEAEQAAEADARARQQRLAKQAAWNEHKATLKQSTASMWTLGRRCDALMYASLTNLGCHLHNYSEWRIKLGQEIQARRQAG
jgi:hypothetical protein